MTRRLASLVAGLPLDVLVPGDAGIDAITVDSRTVRPGSLYFARMGWFVDANRLVPEAIAAGAAAIVVTRADAIPAGCPVPAFLSRAEDADLALLADRYFDHPTRSLRVFAVTGTNGKTSTAFLVHSVLRSLGHRPALIGTVEHRFEDRVYPVRNTTPDGLFVHGFAREVLDAGGDALVIEASSHGLELGRIRGLAVDAAGFTNLTQDHLDFHLTMERYEAAKRLLFTSYAAAAHQAGKSVAGVFVTDHAAGQRMMETADGVDRRISVSADGAATDVSLRATRSGATMKLTGSLLGTRVEGVLPLVGRHNLENVGVALGMVCAVYPGSAEQAVAALARFPGVPGRLERVSAREGDPLVLVDYAHTQDAIERVVAAVTDGAEPPVVVTGAGGERDALKRPAMGAAAAAGAAWAFLTSDNPRSEDATTIASQLASGVADADRARVVIDLDRSSAIERAVTASRGRAVLLVGKGHESKQEIGGTTYWFRDPEEARRALCARRLGVASRDVPIVAGWSAERLARALGGSLVQVGDQGGFGPFATDTRALPPGAIFFALRGERHDAHLLLDQAMDASALVVSRVDAVPRAYRGAVVLVDDPLVALGLGARAILTEARARIGGLLTVAVTGSNGKTTTKEMIAAIMAELHGPVLATPGNWNSRVGLPLTVSRIAPAHRVAVLEMGADRAGEIHGLCDIANPDVGVITSIGRAHIEGFGGTVEDVRRAKLGVFSSPRTVIAVAPYEEARNAITANEIDATKNVVTFGGDGSTIVVTRQPDLLGPVVLRGNGALEGLHATIHLRYPGMHNAANLAAAVLACSAQADRSLRAPPAEAIARAVARLELPGGRLRSLHFGGRTVIDDAYNANPDSVVASLGILAAAPGPRVAVLGDMFELGQAAAALHAEVGRHAARCADLVAAVGELAPVVVEPAGPRGHAFAHTDALADWLVHHAQPGATVLIKGSRGMHLERLVERLRQTWGED